MEKARKHTRIHMNQYASGSGNVAECYAELSVSSPAVAETIACTYCADPRRDGQAEWDRVA